MNPIKPAILALSLLSLAACSGSKKEQPKLDYQSQNRKVVNLEVPPDLTNPGQNSLYQLPAGSGAVRASDINGFDIKSEEPAIGQMETDWAENRAKLSGGGLRSLLEKIGLGGVYSTSERDKFIIRIEQAKNGGTDIFFAHKGMSETYTDRSEERTMWQPRPNDPNLEAAFLARFMQYLGADEKQIQSELGDTAAAKQASNLAKLENGSLLLSGDYSRNWRRTALALDRIGLTVIGQNTEKHAFLVQPAQAEGAAVREKKPGLVGRLFGKKAAAPTQQHELVAFLEPVKEGARLRILNRDGSLYTGPESKEWLNRLHTELR